MRHEGNFWPFPTQRKKKGLALAYIVVQTRYFMNRLLIFVFLFNVLLTKVHADLSAFDGQKRDTPIAAAVAEFNRLAASNPIGKTQPPLTVDEVIAAIRGFTAEEHPHSEVFLPQFKKMAQTGIIPAGCHLSFICGWTPNKDYDYVVWWIDLFVGRENADPAQGSYGYNYRLRAQMISSQPHEDTPAFRKEQQFLMDAWKKTNSSK